MPTALSSVLLEPETVFLLFHQASFTNDDIHAAVNFIQVLLISLKEMSYEVD